VHWLSFLLTPDWYELSTIALMAQVRKLVDVADVDEFFHTHPWEIFFPLSIEIHISIPITPYAISTKEQVN
jgi:hypothetical protein